MGLRYNPFTGSFDMTRSPGSYLDGEVATYSDLPLDTAAAPLNSAWLVREASGLWLLSRKPAGIYIRTATTGVRDDDYTYAGTFPDVFSDANFVVYNDADSTKNLKLDTSGLTTGTTRTLTVPDKSGTIATTNAADLTSGTLADARLSANVARRDAANTFTQNQTLNGTNSTAPNQTAASGASIMTRDLVDARLGFFGSGQTASTFGDIVYSAGATRGWMLRGTASLTNNTETRLFNAQVGGATNAVGHCFFSFNAGGAGFGNFQAMMRGNQGDNVTSNNNSAFTNSTYWVAFGSALTLSTGDTLTGNVTGATAKVWLSTVFAGTSRNDVWLYDVTGIFTSADTNVQVNGVSSGIGISNSVWGANPSAATAFFVYRTRSTTDNAVRMPAVFQRNGGTREVVFQMTAVL